MKRILAIVVALSGGALSGGCMSSVSITSKPSGAQVRIDGITRGHTPLTTRVTWWALKQNKITLAHPECHRFTTWLVRCGWSGQNGAPMNRQHFVLARRPKEEEGAAETRVPELRELPGPVLVVRPGGSWTRITPDLKHRRRNGFMETLIMGGDGVPLVSLSYERATSEKGSLHILAGLSDAAIQGVFRRYPAGKAPEGFFYGCGLGTAEDYSEGAGFIATEAGYKVVDLSGVAVEIGAGVRMAGGGVGSSLYLDIGFGGVF